MDNNYKIISDEELNMNILFDYKVNGKTIVSNPVIYGLNNSLRVSKFPMSTDLDLNNKNYSTTEKLATLESTSGEDNWLSGVILQCDLTFTNKAWIELERYHFIQIVSSQSTMHRITKFDLDTAYNKYVDKEIIEYMKKKVNKYNSFISRKDYDKDKAKEMYLNILYNNPSGMYLTAGITTNYRQLKTVWKQRHNHRLPEWRYFCKFIETLPLMNKFLKLDSKEIK